MARILRRSWTPQLGHMTAITKASSGYSANEALWLLFYFDVWRRAVYAFFSQCDRAILRRYTNFQKIDIATPSTHYLAKVMSIPIL